MKVEQIIQHKEIRRNLTECDRIRSFVLPFSVRVVRDVVLLRAIRSLGSTLERVHKESRSGRCALLMHEEFNIQFIQKARLIVVLNIALSWYRNSGVTALV